MTDKEMRKEMVACIQEEMPTLIKFVRSVITLTDARGKFIEEFLSRAYTTKEVG